MAPGTASEVAREVDGGPLRRLLAPRQIAVVGGAAAEAVVLASRSIGFDGEIWPVHPTRASLAGLPCFPDVPSLPGPPDAAFVSVPREATVDVVRQLRRRGGGGVVCHASGFAEDGDAGAALQRELVDAARGMALVGPNCLGLLNYLDGAALWPDQHGGTRVCRGVGLIAQSGTIAQNLTMQRRGLPLALVVTLGNRAGVDVPAVLEAMLEDPRVTAVGLYLESLPDVAPLARAAETALRRGVPLVALKSGTSGKGARATWSHTSSLAGSDVLCDALFERLGIARVSQVGTLVEALKLLHVHGALHGSRLVSASCSGAEAAHVADLAETRGVDLPELPPTAEAALRSVLGERVAVRNPLDYHTYVWADGPALTRAFTALMSSAFDCAALVLDLPRPDRCDPAAWRVALDAFVQARARTGLPAAVVSSLPDNMPEETAQRLVRSGVVPLQGVGDALEAVAVAAQVGRVQSRVRSGSWTPPRPPPADCPPPGTAGPVDERRTKLLLARCGVPVPAGRVMTGPSQAAAAARDLGYPVVVKTLSPEVSHKSDVGGVRVGLRDDEAVVGAVCDMRARGLGPRFLVEELVADVAAELLVAVRREPGVGWALTLGAGGTLVEVVRDTRTLLLPVSRDDVVHALQRLRIWPLLNGHRGRPADLDAAVAAILGVASLAEQLDGRMAELEVNPLVVGRHGAVAVDALLRPHGLEGPAS